ncbi:aminotransferase class I/II-fold pyridoxal phosphate-dependent enzyme [Verrucosispora sp. WMMD573]|uniref:MalY/PatB family protein n=1 Tax=Verrucosispora sp. WMMD573 TaxID=3015149 RepID=UPI00248BF184|nr:aminotransferase class I/II-fold pyridoxal phosphate-dependent enzyme [Verrucosispora sp. WMMD573]WBB53724.1 aminotransferase class I/II-fold pyridoxal phosphate-dependent enzyme [Verrucosispora sp. WMMD573]
MAEISLDDIDLAWLRQRRTAKWTNYGADILPAWIAEMDFPIAEPIRAALTQAIELDEFGYSPTDDQLLRTSCADFLARRYGWRVDPARIVGVPDGVEGVAAALRFYGGPVIVPTPCYPPFFDVISLLGEEIIEVPLRDGRLDRDGIARALAAGARTLLLCNPHNPTGRVLTRAELADVADLVADHHARVVSDEVHAPLIYPGNSHTPLATIDPNLCATIMSASKAWNVAGLKCAQLILTNDDDFARWQAASPFAVGGRSPLGIVATVAAYREGGDWLDHILDYLDHNRALLTDLLADLLPQISFRPPDGTYLAWLDCRPLGLTDPAAFFLEHARVALSDGRGFGRPGEGFVRLNFATSAGLLRQIVTAMSTAIHARGYGATA